LNDFLINKRTVPPLFLLFLPMRSHPPAVPACGFPPSLATPPLTSPTHPNSNVAAAAAAATSAVTAVTAVTPAVLAAAAASAAQGLAHIDH